MNESDAELREKLWDEYRKYKSKSKSKMVLQISWVSDRDGKYQ